MNDSTDPERIVGDKLLFVKNSFFVYFRSTTNHIASNKWVDIKTIFCLLICFAVAFLLFIDL